MKRVNFYLPENQIADLAKISAETGAPVSELVRRAITMYVDHDNKSKTRETQAKQRAR